MIINNSVKNRSRRKGVEGKKISQTKPLYKTTLEKVQSPTQCLQVRASLANAKETLLCSLTVEMGWVLLEGFKSTQGDG